MKRTSFARWPCSIARAMDIVGDAWTPLVLREAHYGIRRFDEFQASLGIARNTLTDRLRRLVDEELVDRRLSDDGSGRHDYVLTQKGEDFVPVLFAMSAWGDRWLGGEDGPPITLHHHRCGADAHAEVTCSECGEPLTAREVDSRMGPGYPARLASRPDVVARFGR